MAWHRRPSSLLAAAVALALVAGCAPAEDGGGRGGETTVPGGVEVTTPPTETTPGVETTPSEEGTGTVIELTIGEERLQRFAEQARRTGLLQALRGLGPYTVFAPTDDAFGKLGEDRLDELGRPENRDELARILTYHVVPGSWTLEELREADTLPTLSGSYLDVETQGDRVMLNGQVPVGEQARETSAGIVYTIDEVLTPRPGVPKE